MPVVIISEIRGSGTILCASAKISVSDDIAPMVPGIKKSPATVARQYTIPHFIRDWNSISCERAKEVCVFSLLCVWVIALIKVLPGAQDNLLLFVKVADFGDI
jgi:hypothetical protein